MSKTKPVQTKTKEVVKDQIKGKKVGNTLILTIDKKLINKKVTKEETDTILAKVATYNKKPSDKQRDAIKKLMTPKAIEANKIKEKEKTKLKGLKTLVKKETKSLNRSKSKAKEKKEEVTPDTFKRFIELGKKGEKESLNNEEMKELKALIAKFAVIEEKVEKATMSLQEMIEAEKESITSGLVGRYTNIGYKHPVTGRTWSGEYYR